MTETYKPSVKTPSNYLDTEAAARYLGNIIAGRQLAIMRQQGGGPKFVKVGRRVAYTVNDLDAWAASRTFGSTSESRRAGIY